MYSLARIVDNDCNSPENSEWTDAWIESGALEVFSALQIFQVYALYLLARDLVSRTRIALNCKVEIVMCSSQ